MKFKWTVNEYSVEEMVFTMNGLGFVAGCAIFTAIIRNLTLCYQLGKEDNPDFIWQMLPENITLLSLIICGVLMFLMIRNVRKKQVFTIKNANLIMGIGWALEGNGILQSTLHIFVPITDSGSKQHLIFFLIGIFFFFIYCLFKLGIKMQEEQDLTV